MRIAILSCFYPFRGGIAQFNANLLTELGKNHEVRAFNFSRQYPSFLFPGKTQYVSPEDEAVAIESEALLDTANPFNWGKTARRIKEYNPDLLIVRYWMSYFAPSLGYICKRMAPGCKTIGILDNVIPHEPHFFDATLTRYFLKGIDGCVCLCNEVRNDLLNIRKDAVSTVLPHPIYNHFGKKLDRKDAEMKLGIETGKRNLLFFGLIREYKGLDILIKAFDLLDDRYQLIIAGEPYGSFERYQALIDANRNSPRIKLYPDYIKDSEVKDYFSCADVCVLPYKSATQSGISAISNHFELPMIVTDVGGLKETVGDRGIGIVCKEKSPECVAEEIVRFFEEEDLRKNLIQNIGIENERLSWNRFCKDLISFASSL